MNTDSRPTRLAALLLAGLAMAAFMPSLSGDFLLDDENYILANPILNNPRRWGRVFTDPAALTVDMNQAPMMYRPLTALSFAVNQRLGGYNAFWYHFASSVLHAANAVLLFSLVRRLLGPGPGLWPPLGAARGETACSGAVGWPWATRPAPPESSSSSPPAARRTT